MLQFMALMDRSDGLCLCRKLHRGPRPLFGNNGGAQNGRASANVPTVRCQIIDGDANFARP